MAEARTAPRADRSTGIDFARGIALLGIILVNARFFFLPFGSAVDATVLPEGMERSTLDWAAHDAVDALATFKFISLFSLLFGFGLSQQAARAVAAGRSRWDVGLRRLGVMLVVGLVHGVFLWAGDILTLYATLGLLVVACIGLDDRWLRRVTIGVLAGTLLLTAAGAGLEWAMSATTEAPEVAAATGQPTASETTAPPTGFDAMLAAEFDLQSDTWMQAEITAYREGPWSDALVFRSAEFGMSLAIAPISYGWQSFLMMLLGVWAQRSGLFASDAGLRRRRLAWRLIPAGLAFALGGVLPWWLLGRDSAAAGALSMVSMGLGALLLPVGYACLAIEFGPRLPAFLRAPVQAAGSIGLTVYLCESVVCTGIANWWGLGRFATMLDAGFTPLVVGVWAALAVAALAWTRLFGAGPMERLWRLAAYGKGA